MEQITLDEIVASIDSACDSSDVATLKESLDKLDSISDQATSGIEHAKINFYKANCHSAIREMNGNHQSWNWEFSELEKEIYCFRAACGYIAGVEPTEDRSDLRFRISTNLANALNHVGRFVEAISLWDEVLTASPNFSMSIANRALALYYYGLSLYDPGHQCIFLNESYHQTKLALSLGVEIHATEGVAKQLEDLSKLGDWENFNFQPKEESRGRSKEERAYRTWCINHKLFLNPLNDIWHKDIVANDVFTFPPSTTQSKDSRRDSMPPEVYGIYNQLKQEYISARYMFFEAINESQKPYHFSDQRVVLYDMLDCRQYGLWIEKTKMVFLAAHAIFDKIAYLVNEYWSLGLPPDKIAFKSCWFNDLNPSKGLAVPFKSSENWPLRGLYWLSKDFVGKKGEDSLLQPDAWHIGKIRHHIAHKYLKVFHTFVDAKEQRKRNGHEWEYPISDQELIAQTLKLLVLVRNALIYVSLAAHADERRKKATIGHGMIGNIPLYEIEKPWRL